MGRVTAWDVNTLEPITSFKGHDQIINAIDGCGGLSLGCGPPELVTASRDGIEVSSLFYSLGSIKIWDLRQGDSPVAVLAPAEGQPIIDPWTVCFGT